MKPNVDFITKDWKESWEGKDITKLIHKMPRDNVIEVFDDPTSDMNLMISCPQSFIELLWKDIETNEDWTWGSGVFCYGTWLMDYCQDEDGYYWDGKVLVVIKGDKTYSVKEWEKRVEERTE